MSEREQIEVPEMTPVADPLIQFAGWMREAEASEVNDPNGVALATVDAEGLPDLRMVLLKGYDAAGFVFFTNFERRRCCSTGSRCAARSASADRSAWSTMPRRTPISPRARATAGSAPGPRASRGRCPAGPNW